MLRSRRNPNKTMYSFVIFIMAFIAIYLFVAKGQLTDSMDIAVVDNAKKTTNLLNDSLEKYFLISNLIAGSREIFYEKTLVLPSVDTTTFKNILKDENVVGILCLSKNGDISAINNMGEVKKKLSEEPWMQEVVAKKGLGGKGIHKSIFSDKLVLTILNPVVIEDKVEYEGFAGIEVDLSKIFSDLQARLPRFEGQYYMIASNEMNLVFHPDSKRIGKMLENTKVTWTSTEQRSGKTTLFGVEEAYFMILDVDAGRFKVMSVLPIVAIRNSVAKWLMNRGLYVLCVILVSLSVTYIIRGFQKYRKTKKDNDKLFGEIDSLKIKDEARDEFWAVSIHEVQNTQNGLITLARMLLERASLSADAKNSVYTILTSGKRVMNMLTNLAGYSSKAGKKFEMKLVPSNLYDNVDFVLRILAATAERNMQLINCIPENFAIVLADAESLEQAIMNIVGNAIKFTHEGELIIEATEMKDDFVHIMFKDSGRGILPEKLESINAALRSNSMKLDPDLGLGLNIAKKIIRGHGGEIWLESEVDRGTKAHITLKMVTNKKEKNEKDEEDQIDEVDENRS